MSVDKQRYNFDTAATLFPAITSKENSSVFRISIVLKEDVNKEILQKALDKVFCRFPFLALKVEKTAFSAHFIKNENRPIIREDREYPCRIMNPKEIDDFMFSILYYKNRVSLEVNHSLSDGTGMLEFIKTLLYQYFLYLDKDVKLEEMVLDPHDKPIDEECEDSFKKNYCESTKTEIPKAIDAFKLKGTQYKPYGHNLTIGVASTSALKDIAKKNSATITQYLSALMAYSIYKTKVKPKIDTAPIVIAIPVNLRTLFPSRTLKNFFCVININLEISECTSMEALIVAVKREFKAKIKKEYMIMTMNSNHSVTENIIVRKAPLFLRHAGTKFVYAFLIENVKTITLSNLGQISLPKSMEEFVERFEVSIYPTKISPINCCMCSYKERFSISFVRSITDSTVLEFFFKFLSSETGSKVELYTNEWGVGHDTL